VALDVTLRKHLEERVARISRANLALGRVGEAVAGAVDESALYQRVCDILVAAGGYSLAWVGLAERDQDKNIRPVARAGRDEGYVDAVQASWADNARGRGPAGEAIRTGRVQTETDVFAKAGVASLKDAAQARGLVSGVSIPLSPVKDAEGMFAVYASVFEKFDAEELGLLVEIAALLTLGIKTIGATHAREAAREELRHYHEHLEELVRDRTAQLERQADDLLELSTEFSAIFNASVDGMFLVNPAGQTLLRCNAACERYLGWSQAEFCHLQVVDVVPPTDLPAVLEHIRAFVEDHDHTPKELRLRTKAGAFLLIRATPSPIVVSGEDVILVTFHDLAEEKATAAAITHARDQAEAANRAKSAFLANMSHEIRTPMNAVLGFAQLLLRDPATTQAQREHLGTIARAGDHLLSLIDDILQLARVESGRVALHETVFELSAVLADLEVLFRERAREQGLRLLVEGVAPLPRYIRADEAKLRQILTNLIGNAVKFTDHGGVAVRARAHDGKLVVEVEDSGPGIAPDELPRLFQKFEQTASGRQAKQGTGLGLAISREFAQLMGGQIGATSRPGEGSVFRLELPLQEGAEADLVRRAPTRRVTRLVSGPTRYRILVVDDKEDNRTFLTALLEAVGFDTAQAADGEEALRAFENYKPHVVLMDMRMPVMDGTEAIGRLRATPQGRAVKIVAVTASAFEEDRAAARVAGADDFVSKPFRESVLFEKLGALLGVEYEYEDQVDAAPVQAAKAEMDVTRERLAVLPAGLRERVRQATLVADLDTVLDLLELAKAHDADLAARLRALAERFAYPQLLELLRSEEGDT